MIYCLACATVGQSVPARLSPLPSRTFSLTEAFRSVIAKSLFGGTIKNHRGTDGFSRSGG